MNENHNKARALNYWTVMTFGHVFVCPIHNQKETPRTLHAILNI